MQAHRDDARSPRPAQGLVRRTHSRKQHEQCEWNATISGPFHPVIVNSGIVQSLNDAAQLRNKEQRYDKLLTSIRLQRKERDPASDCQTQSAAGIARNCQSSLEKRSPALQFGTHGLSSSGGDAPARTLCTRGPGIEREVGEALVWMFR